MSVRAALDELSPDCSEILDRFFCRDESYRTIGAELELPVRHDREQDRPLPRTAARPPRAGKKTDRPASGGKVDD